MRRALALVVLCAAAAGPLGAQRFVLGIAAAGGDYREISNDLRYRVSGIAGSAATTLGRFSAEFVVSALNHEPYDKSVAAKEFKATQFDGWLRYRVYRGVSLEVGAANRTVEDAAEFDGQSAGAIRVGAHSAVTLGPNAAATVRFDYLAGGKFSGGGKASFGMDVGLGFYYAFARGRVRVTGDSQFQRYNRTVDLGGVQEDVPLQQVLARVGLAVAF